MALVYLLTAVWMAWAGRPSGPVLWAVGTVWLVLTVGFEDLLGLMRGMSAAEIMAAYSPLSPTLWDFVLLGIFVAPVIVGRMLADQYG